MLLSCCLCGGCFKILGIGGFGRISAEEAKEELLETVRKYETRGLASSVENFLASVESGDISLSTLDEIMYVDSNFTPETEAAYRRWRDAYVREME